MPPAFRTTIEGIGADGDGIGRVAGGEAAYVPFTLPDEEVAAHPTRQRGEGWAGVADEIIRTSPDRVPAPCPHFGLCGGCVLQHWRDEPLAHWKAARVAGALAKAGFDWVPVAPAKLPPATRRRMDLAIRRRPTGVVIGLHGTDPSVVVPIDDCRVLHPVLLALLPALREVLDRLAGLRREGSAVLNLLDTGPDLLLRHDAELTPQDRQRLAAFAAARNVPRIAASQGRAPGASWEIACQLAPATIRFSGISVSPPPGAFLQASAESEAAIIAAVLSGLPDRLTARARVAELYAGCGTLTFALAQKVRVAAFEGHAEAAACLSAAARQAGRVSVHARDLARQPLSAKELAEFAAIVLDPPFTGAADQMPGIAAAGVPRIIYVSCNPAALARDATALRGAGYRLRSATAIDQFAWSAHVESVIVFAR